MVSFLILIILIYDFIYSALSVFDSVTLPLHYLTITSQLSCRSPFFSLLNLCICLQDVHYKTSNFQAINTYWSLYNNNWISTREIYKLAKESKKLNLRDHMNTISKWKLVLKGKVSFGFFEIFSINLARLWWNG